MKNIKQPIQVLIADSQYLITESLKLILRNDGRFSVEKIVSGKDDLINSLKLKNTALLVIDPLLINIESFAELKEIKCCFPDLKILIVTNNLSKKELYELSSIGITNIMLKTVDKQEIIEALNAVITGKKHYSTEIFDLLFEKNEQKSSAEEPGQLTNSEIDIVRLITEGLTTKQIAAKKFISFHTVISHRKNIFRKLGVSSISELILYSIKAGWINTIEYHI